MKTLAQELEETKAALATATATITASAATAESFNVKISALETEKAALTAQLGESKTQIASLTAEVDALKAAEKTASAKALEIAASVGVPPVSAQPKADGGKEMSRAEFSNLSPKAMFDFVKRGGKIVD